MGITKNSNLSTAFSAVSKQMWRFEGIPLTSISLFMSLFSIQFLHGPIKVGGWGGGGAYYCLWLGIFNFDVGISIIIEIKDFSCKDEISYIGLGISEFNVGILNTVLKVAHTN